MSRRTFLIEINQIEVHTLELTEIFKAKKNRATNPTVISEQSKLRTTKLEKKARKQRQSQELYLVSFATLIWSFGIDSDSDSDSDLNNVLIHRSRFRYAKTTCFPIFKSVMRNNVYKYMQATFSFHLPPPALFLSSLRTYFNTLSIKCALSFSSTKISYSLHRQRYVGNRVTIYFYFLILLTAHTSTSMICS